jgi:hypothetical protein
VLDHGVPQNRRLLFRRHKFEHLNKTEDTSYIAKKDF